MKERGVTKPKEIIKDGAGDTTPTWNSKAFYAVANGTRPGIYSYWQYEFPQHEESIE
jgi:viroplasmin and RNaseH domain-containing protein